jgi:hypothetical protein
MVGFMGFYWLLKSFIYHHPYDRVEGVLTYYASYLLFIVAFKIKYEEMFPSSMFGDTVQSQFSARQWLLLIKKKSEKSGKLPIDFCCFIMGLHSAPSSSAPRERIFSTCGTVWTKLRNRLG